MSSSLDSVHSCLPMWTSPSSAERTVNHRFNCVISLQVSHGIPKDSKSLSCSQVLHLQWLQAFRFSLRVAEVRQWQSWKENFQFHRCYQQSATAGMQCSQAQLPHQLPVQLDFVKVVQVDHTQVAACWNWATFLKGRGTWHSEQIVNNVPHSTKALDAPARRGLVCHHQVLVFKQFSVTSSPSELSFSGCETCCCSSLQLEKVGNNT